MRKENQIIGKQVGEIGQTIRRWAECGNLANVSEIFFLKNCRVKGMAYNGIYEPTKNTTKDELKTLKNKVQYLVKKLILKGFLLKETELVELKNECLIQPKKNPYYVVLTGR